MKNVESYSATYHFNERTAPKVVRYLEEHPELTRSGKPNEEFLLYNVGKDGGFGTIVLRRRLNEIFLANVDSEVFAKIGRLVTGVDTK